MKKKKEIKCNNIIKRYKKIINFDNVNWQFDNFENINKHHLNSPQIPDHPYKIVIIGDSGSGNSTSLFNLKNEEPDIDKVYMLKIHMKQNIDS